MFQKSRLNSNNRFSKWLTDVQSELEKIVIEDQKFSELDEMNEELADRYKCFFLI